MPPPRPPLVISVDIAHCANSGWVRAHVDVDRDWWMLWTIFKPGKRALLKLVGGFLVECGFEIIADDPQITEGTKDFLQSVVEFPLPLEFTNALIWLWIADGVTKVLSKVHTTIFVTPPCAPSASCGPYKIDKLFPQFLINSHGTFQTISFLGTPQDPGHWDPVGTGNANVPGDLRYQAHADLAFTADPGGDYHVWAQFAVGSGSGQFNPTVYGPYLVTAGQVTHILMLDEFVAPHGDPQPIRVQVANDAGTLGTMLAASKWDLYCTSLGCAGGIDIIDLP